jgi:hypothetical protein
MEYLVAFQLADGIFCGQRASDEERIWGDGPATTVAGSAQPTRLTSPDKAVCLPIWELYQTHEVSDLFMDEVRRISIEMGLSDEERDRYFTTAFSAVLADLAPGPGYLQNVEEAMFYVGRFKVRDNRLLERLRKVLSGRRNYHPVYYRTASLAMAALEGPQHCVGYVLALLDSFDGDREDLNLNNRIQRYYYGDDQIGPKLEPAVDKYIAGWGADSSSGQEPDPVMAHRIFTYFVTVPPVGDQVPERLMKLERAHAAARARQDAAMSKILDGAERILRAGLRERDTGTPAD